MHCAQFFEEITMPSRIRHGVLFAFALFAAAASASAQADPTTWRRGTTLNVFGGLAATRNDRAPLVGGALGWEITPRIGVEASGAWLGWGHEAHSFDAAIRALVPLRTSRSIAPFLAAGAGLHRTWFQVADPRVPQFYRRRIEERPGALGAAATFTDPTLVFGGGINVFLTRQIAVRPEVDATIVMRDSRTRVMPTVRVHFAYHFEDHPITSQRAVARRD
jgi:hypothetical protein